MKAEHVGAQQYVLLGVSSSSFFPLNSIASNEERNMRATSMYAGKEDKKTRRREIRELA
jgi:hypothetical protein